MICKGWLKNLSQNWDSKRLEVMLEIEANPADVERYKDKELSVDIKQYRQRRSLEANAYHWTLCTQIARALNVSVPFVHNKLLRECRYFEKINGQNVLVTLEDSEEVENQVLEAESYHLAKTSDVRTGKDGKPYRTYVLLRGSHDFNTEEMSFLIDRTIAAAKEQNIETITPNEKREMLERYGQKYSER